MSKHKYSTIVLLIIVFIITIVILVSGLDIGDDSDCSNGFGIITDENIWKCVNLGDIITWTNVTVINNVTHLNSTVLNVSILYIDNTTFVDNLITNAHNPGECSPHSGGCGFCTGLSDKQTCLDNDFCCEWINEYDRNFTINPNNNSLIVNGTICDHDTCLDFGSVSGGLSDGHIHDQDLNTTSHVEFESLQSKINLTILNYLSNLPGASGLFFDFRGTDNTFLYSYPTMSFTNSYGRSTLWSEHIVAGHGIASMDSISSLKDVSVGGTLWVDKVNGATLFDTNISQNDITWSYTIPSTRLNKYPLPQHKVGYGWQPFVIQGNYSQRYDCIFTFNNTNAIWFPHSGFEPVNINEIIFTQGSTTYSYSQVIEDTENVVHRFPTSITSAKNNMYVYNPVGSLFPGQFGLFLLNDYYNVTFPEHSCAVQEDFHIDNITFTLNSIDYIHSNLPTYEYVNSGSFGTGSYQSFTSNSTFGTYKLGLIALINDTEISMHYIINELSSYNLTLRYHTGENSSFTPDNVCFDTSGDSLCLSGTTATMNQGVAETGMALTADTGYTAGLASDFYYGFNGSHGLITPLVGSPNLAIDTDVFVDGTFEANQVDVDNVYIDGSGFWGDAFTDIGLYSGFNGAITVSAYDEINLVSGVSHIQLFPATRTYTNDNKPIALGSSFDSTITYNSSDLIIDPNAVGTGSLVIDGDVSIGSTSKAKGNPSFAGGYASTATHYTSFAYGDQASATNTDAIAMGDGASASFLGAVAIGEDSTASAYDSYALGFQTLANGSFSYALGQIAEASGYDSFAIGSEANAYGHTSIAMGEDIECYGTNSFCISLIDAFDFEHHIDNQLFVYGGTANFTGNVTIMDDWSVRTTAHPNVTSLIIEDHFDGQYYGIVYINDSTSYRRIRGNITQWVI